MSNQLDWIIAFRVYGIPVPGGSKGFKGMMNTAKGPKPILVDSGGARLKEWRRRVEESAKVAMVGRKLLEEPLCVHWHFFMPRPKYHYRRDGTLRPEAPGIHSIAPDTTKLVRGTEDAMTGIVWKDDSLIAKQESSKFYGKAGAFIIVYPWDEADASLEVAYLRSIINANIAGNTRSNCGRSNPVGLHE